MSAIFLCLWSKENEAVAVISDKLQVDALITVSRHHVVSQLG